MKKKVLIFPCGSEVGLEIRRALSGSAHFEMYGASSTNDHGKFVFKNYVSGLPYVDDDAFIPFVNEIIIKYGIDFIFPAHDSAVLKLAEYSDKLDAMLVTSAYATCKICRVKSLTYKALSDSVAVPKVFYSKDEIKDLPVFAKPDVGQGSKGARLVMDEKALEEVFDENAGLIVTEYMPGSEYTIDCFTSNKGKLLFAKGRQRNRISNGISVNSSPKNDKRFWELAEKINSHLNFNGVWFFQVKEKAGGELVLMEVAPRVSGTMGLYRAQGINLAKLSLFNAMGQDVRIIKNDFGIEVDRALFSVYDLYLSYDTVYLDFDDTVIVDGDVNLNVISFIYQCHNKSKTIVLLTRHAENIHLTLNKFNISIALFSEIVHVAEDDEKYHHVDSKSAIFVDDSFAERAKVSEKCGIPVFDIDAVESLIDWKS